MIRERRRAHLAAWLLLGPAMLALVLAAVALRAPTPADAPAEASSVLGAP